MNFTENQKNAINVRNCSLIISAGAGSGKTAVLTERILERICNENDDCNINDFLIVTFSRMAAKELCDRIRKKLSERASEQPGNQKIVRNLALMPLANIMTIDSFCYQIVRRNFQRIGISASVRIADTAEIEVIREKIMNEVIDGYFESSEKDEMFFAAYEIFADSKKDENFVQTLLSLEWKLSNITDRDGFCKSIIKGYREVAQGKDLFSTEFGRKIADYIKDEADKTMSAMQNAMDACAKYEILLNKYYPVIENCFEFARSVYHAADESYEKTYSIVNEYIKPTFRGKNVPTTFENPCLKIGVYGAKSLAFDGFLREMKELCCCDGALLKLAAEDTGNVLDKIFEIVDRFKETLDKRKKELGIIEFSDAERYALELLVESFEPFKVTELAKELSDSFEEIYIDEYQDVNPLQDMIFKAVAKNRDSDGECNRFMVGDIKQSIYRFRGARSEIFMSYRDSFEDIESSSGRAKRIFMGDNFRCSKSVIDLTNNIFRKLMGKFYGDGDALTFSRTEKLEVKHKVKLLGFHHDSKICEGASSTEIEAAIICGKIKEIVNNPEYTDSDGKTFTYSDIGILAHDKNTLAIYESVLNDCGIPSFCNSGESFYAKKEVLLCINLLNAIDNPERDIYLAGFMRSFAGEFTDDELAIIKNAYRYMSLYRAVINYSENGEDTALSVKCRDFIEKIRSWRTYSRGKGADKLIWKLYSDTDMLNFCASSSFTHDPKGARKNLMKLYQMARDFSKTSFRGTGAFLEYVNSTMNSKNKVKAERVLTGDCVSLMTVHASKGLEFPVCFVTGLSKKFNKTDEREKLVFTESAGIGLKLCDTEGIKCTDSGTGLVNIETPFRKFAANVTGKELGDEEIRVLYVALTRARDMLFLTASFPKSVDGTIDDALAYSMSNRFDMCNNYFSLILSSLIGESALEPFFEAAGRSMIYTGFEAEKYLECEYMDAFFAKEIYDRITCPEEAENEMHTDYGIDEELLGKLEAIGNFRPKAASLPAKVTVSKLKKGLIDEEALVNAAEKEALPDEKQIPRFILGEKEADGAEKGTALHMFMQFCDFEAAETDIEEEAQRLCVEGFIDERQKNLLDIAKLKEFFASDFYKEIRNSKKIYREQRFNLGVDVFDNSLSDEVLVQGVIDLFYENGDGTYTVVDFKTDRAFGDGAEKTLIDRHKEQLMYYKRAVEEMTGAKVSSTLIYSFSLMRRIEV